MTGVCYATSAEMAKRARRLRRATRATEDAMLRVIRNHRRAAHGNAPGYEELAIAPVPLDRRRLPRPAIWSSTPCARLGPRRWRSARRMAIAMRRSTVIAPTGTIGLVMDCDTTGIEPDFALVKFKKLAGGGYFKIINRAVPEALRALGYARGEIDEIEAYAVGHGTPRTMRRRSTTSRCGRKGFTRRRDRRRRSRRSPPPSTSDSSSTNGRSARSSARDV